MPGDVKVQSSSKPWMSVILRRVSRVLVGFVLFWIFAIVVGMLPIIQTYILYAHHIDIIGYKKFEHPEHYGLAPGRTVNMNLESSDNVTIGAWFIFSDQFYRSLPHPHLHLHTHTKNPPKPTTHESIQQASKQHIPKAVKKNPTILYLHGNTGTRAHRLRTILYSSVTARLGVNILAIDYRGFGDSTGHPTVQGVGQDARAGFEYLVNQGAKPEDILIVGHSLGTAVAGLLAAELGQEGVNFRGVVFMSPFSSLRALMDHYYLFGFFPLIKPISKLPFIPHIITWSMAHKFDTLALVPHIKSSVLIAHAENDFDIPHIHSSILFDSFLQPHLIPASSLNSSMNDATLKNTYPQPVTRDDLVSTTTVTGYGTLEQADLGKRKVALLKIERGGHDIGPLEGVHDTMGRLFGLY